MRWISVFVQKFYFEESPVKYLGFDIDNTLLASQAGFVAANQETARRLGLPIPSEEKLATYSTWDALIEQICGEHLEPGVFKELYKQVAIEYPYKIVPGANELLEKAARSRRLFALSKRPREMLNLRVQQSGLRLDLCSEVWCEEDLRQLGFPNKPDPKCFQPAIEILHSRLGVPRGAELSTCCAYVGDELEDHAAAKGAGLEFFGVLTGQRTRENFLSAGVPAERILASVSELAMFLDV